MYDIFFIAILLSYLSAKRNSFQQGFYEALGKRLDFCRSLKSGLRSASREENSG